MQQVAVRPVNLDRKRPLAYGFANFARLPIARATRRPTFLICFGVKPPPRFTRTIAGLRGLDLRRRRFARTFTVRVRYLILTMVRVRTFARGLRFLRRGLRFAFFARCWAKYRRRPALSLPLPFFFFFLCAFLPPSLAPLGTCRSPPSAAPSSLAVRADSCRTLHETKPQAFSCPETLLVPTCRAGLAPVESLSFAPARAP